MLRGMLGLVLISSLKCRSDTLYPYIQGRETYRRLQLSSTVQGWCIGSIWVSMNNLISQVRHCVDLVGPGPAS